LEAILPDHNGDSRVPEWMGFLSYELGMYSDAQKKIKHSPLRSMPHAYFQRCSVVLAFDHIQKEAKVHVADAGLYLLEEDEKQWVQRLSEPEKWEELAENLRISEEDHTHLFPLALAKPHETYEEYKLKIDKAKELIHSGDIYQVNLSQQFLFKGNRDPFRIFNVLAHRNPAPFSAYLKLKNFSIVSSSPERFLSKQEGWLETRPIKGTTVRGKTPEEDQTNLASLLNSEKNKAELLMITDLARNDLGKVSLPGSVSTVKTQSVASYENVHHLFSIVKSKALPGLHSVDILRACFPGGSITGCPKLSAIEVIAQLENRARGLYTGSIGYFAGNGDFDFNIAIRTLTIMEDHINVQLGGAIVADSDAREEYEETLHKGASIFKALEVDPAGVAGL
jgi:para-aminobenzoate synthetase component 1